VMIFSADEIPYSDKDVATTMMWVETMITLATTIIPIMTVHLEFVVVVDRTTKSSLWTTAITMINTIVMTTTAPFDALIQAELMNGQHNIPI
jgi:hypothetical protein